MKTLSNIFYTIVLLCTFSACWDVNCPDLGESVLSWFPYEEGSVIRLENKTTGTLLTIPVTFVMINHTTQYNTGHKCGHCDDHINISSNAVKFNISVYIESTAIQGEKN